MKFLSNPDPGYDIADSLITASDYHGHCSVAGVRWFDMDGLPLSSLDPAWCAGRQYYEVHTSFGVNNTDTDTDTDTDTNIDTDKDVFRHQVKSDQI